MDVFSHGLWGYALAYPSARKQQQPKKALWGLVLGMLPDVIPFLPVQIYFLFHRVSFDAGLFFPVPQHWVFSWAIESYNYTHSLVLWAVVFALVLIVRKGKVWIPLYAWGLHVLMDIPTHPDFFQTPFLFPLSDFKLIGFGLSWAHPLIFFVNWAVLAVIYVFIFRDFRKNKRANS